MQAAVFSNSRKGSSLVSNQLAQQVHEREENLDKAIKLLVCVDVFTL